jgi:hypothetical protein
MSSTLRKLQRDVIRNKCYQRDGHTGEFKDEWEKIHYGKEVDNEGKVVSVKSKKVEKPKQKHFDDGKSYVKYLKAVKTYIDSVRNKQTKANMNAKAKVC